MFALLLTVNLAEALYILQHSFKSGTVELLFIFANQCLCE